MNHESASELGIGRRITRYSTILTVSGIVCKILLLVYTVLAVQILGREQFGRIEYFIEMGIIFSVLADFGLEQTVTREISRRRSEIHNFLYPLFTYRLAAVCFGGAVMAIFLTLVGRAEHTWDLIAGSITYFFSVFLMMLLRAFTRGFEFMTVEGFANVVEKIAHIGLGLLFLYLYPHLPVLILCYTTGSLVAVSIYAMVIQRRFGWKKHAFSLQGWFDWQKLAVPIGLSAVCILLLHREDTAMVNWIRGDDETGLYRAPYRFLEGLFLFPQVMAISAYPIFSKLHHEARPFVDTAADLLFGLFLISLPMAVGGTCIADEMMLQLTPELGKAGGTVFKILLWSLPFIYANFLLGTILNATNRQHQNFLASACGLAGNALLNIPGIYFWGAYGASVVTILSQGLYGFIMLFFIRDYPLFTRWKRYGSIVLACLAMAAVIQSIPLRWYTAVLLGAGVYFLLLLCLRAVTRKDIEQLLKVFGRKHGSPL